MNQPTEKPNQITAERGTQPNPDKENETRIDRNMNQTESTRQKEKELTEKVTWPNQETS